MTNTDPHSPLRIVFAGTPAFALPPLTALINSSYHPIAVYTQPDRPAGRGRQLTPSPVKQLALAHNIPTIQITSFKSPEAVAQFAALKPDLLIVVAYGLLLPQAILDLPRLGCINIHASLLPRWRGAAPIQRALLAGDCTAGVGLMRMSLGLDEGPVYAEASLPISPAATSADLHDALATLGANLLIDKLPAIINGQLLATPQASDGVVYAHKLTKEEADLDWSLPATILARHIRGYIPWPVAYTTLRNQRIRCWQAVALDEVSHSAPGTILSATADGIKVATGAQVLLLQTLQLPGGKPCAVSELLKAHRELFSQGQFAHANV